MPRDPDTPVPEQPPVETEQPTAQEAFVPPPAGGSYKDGQLLHRTQDCGPEGPKG